MKKCCDNINRMEFIITYDCTGHCIHCSEGDHKHTGIYLDGNAAAKALHDLFEKYKLTSVMTFGGEPLLHPESVYAIHHAASQLKIPRRQLITNGYFSKDISVIKSVCSHLKEYGVNDILLSVDAFHQNHIPIDTVKLFATELVKLNLPVRLSPAWLVDKNDDNPYNRQTLEIIKEFLLLGIEESAGNIIFPEGNALKYLGEYFDENKQYTNPYAEDPFDIKTISVEPDGGVLDSNIYDEDIITALDNYINN